MNPLVRYQRGLTLLQRIEAKYIPEPNSGCWLWFGALSGGYARIGVKEGTTLVYRILYEQKYGPVPEGLELRKKCHLQYIVDNREHIKAQMRAYYYARKAT